jgi:hypothetical protein
MPRLLNRAAPVAAWFACAVAPDFFLCLSCPGIIGYDYFNL